MAYAIIANAHGLLLLTLHFRRRFFAARHAYAAGATRQGLHAIFAIRH